MEFVTFIADTKANTLPELGTQVVKVLSCQLFLVDYVPIADLATTKKFTETFQLAKHAYEVIDTSQITIEAKKRDFKSVLSDCKNIFEKDLINYRYEVEEYQHFGDVNEIETYVNKSRSLDDRLTEALKKMSQFNKEEIFFNIKESVYPLRKSVSTTKTASASQHSS